MGSPVFSLSSSWSRCMHTRASLGGTHTWPLPLLDFSNKKVVSAFCGAAWSLAAAILLWGCSWVPRSPGGPRVPSCSLWEQPGKFSRAVAVQLVCSRCCCLGFFLEQSFALPKMCPLVYFGGKFLKFQVLFRTRVKAFQNVPVSYELQAASA